jgi:hypothetical protein
MSKTPNEISLSRRHILRSGIALAASRSLKGFGICQVNRMAPIVIGCDGGRGRVLERYFAAYAFRTNDRGLADSQHPGGRIHRPRIRWTFLRKNVTPVVLFLNRERGRHHSVPGLGASVLRLGGDSVDTYVWTPNGAGRTKLEIAPSDVASLAAFVRAAGWQCIYGINLGGAATGATTPALAAAEVAYAVEQFGSSLLAIEIGNEPDAYGAPGDFFAGNWSLADYLTLWGQFCSAILAVNPGVPIAGPEPCRRCRVVRRSGSAKPWFQS